MMMVGPAEDPIADDDPEYRADLMLDVIMLGLRTAEGVDLSRFAREFGSVNAGKAEGAVREHVRAERVEVLERSVGGSCGSQTRRGSWSPTTSSRTSSWSSRDAHAAQNFVIDAFGLTGSG